VDPHRFPLSLPAAFSIVIRLFQRFKFVDILQNSAVPLSNEFVLQLIETTFCYAALSAPLGPKNAIFVVLTGLEPAEIGTAIAVVRGSHP
jgi:hypothetical protein